LFAAILLEHHEEKYDWASKTLHDLEKLNHAFCSWLTEHGYNEVGLKAKANTRSRSLHNQRVAADVSVEQRVKAMVFHGINLSSLLNTIGPTCLSTDEIFIAFEYRDHLKVYTVQKKESAFISKKRETQEKAKELMTLNKRTCMVGDFQLLLRWKLGDRYAEHNKKKAAELQALWLKHGSDDIPDIVLPPPPQEPPVPTIDDTELGRARLKQFQNMLVSAQNYDNAQLHQLTVTFLAICNERGVAIGNI
jgi:hypothetical protein